MNSKPKITARVLVTGSRLGVEARTVWRELDDAYENRFSGNRLVVVQGGAAGADSMAIAWAIGRATQGWDVTYETHRAFWQQDGVFVPSAGHQRNQRMVDMGADLVLAFVHNNSAGASGCMRAAMKAGLEVRVLRTWDIEESK